MNRVESWRIARLLMRTHLPLAVLLWAGFVVAVCVLVAAVAMFRSIEISTWDAGAPLLRWLAFGHGLYLTGRLLPIYVAHGQTRRAFMTQASAFVAFLTAVMAALITVTYLLERLLYRLLDWPQKINENRFFTDSTELLPIFVSYWMLLLVWSATGAFLAAAFYRLDAGGILALPVGVALVVLVGVAAGFDNIPFIGRLVRDLDAPLAVTAALGSTTLLTCLLLTWALLRDVPIKNRTG